MIIAIKLPWFQKIKINQIKEFKWYSHTLWKIIVWSKNQVKRSTKCLKFTLHFTFLELFCFITVDKLLSVNHKYLKFYVLKIQS